MRFVITLRNLVNMDKKSPFQQDINSYESLEWNDIAVKLYKESRHSANDVSHPIKGDVLDKLKWQVPLGSDAFVLPSPLQKGRSLQDAMRERTSIRFYDATPIRLDQLSTMLKLAADGDQQDWPQEESTGVDIRFVVVAWNVEDLPSAVYQYENITHTLLRTHAAPDQATEAKNLVMQIEFACAPMIILITGNLAAASARYGSWGHRQLLLRAGAAGQRLWLASLGINLVGTVFAGFLPHAAHKYIGIDGYKCASLLAYSTGHAIDMTSVYT